MKQVLVLLMWCTVHIGVYSQTTTGLVAHWGMNGNFTDSTPAAINGTNYGATATTNNLGVVNRAMNFSNPTSTVAQYATHPITAALNFSGTQNFTISLAFYINSPWVHNGGLYDNCLNYSGPGIYIWLVNGNPKFQFNYKNGSLASASNIPLGTWKLLTCVRDNGTLRIYLDGVLNSSGPEGTSTPSYSFPARFGTMFYHAQSPAEYNGLHGKLDYVRIYNRALTQTEITGLYNAWISPLPVTFGRFTANRSDDKVQLNWETQQEQNSSHFVVQRSINGIDFTDLATVAAAGNSTTTLKYQYSDPINMNLLSASMVSYRLKQVDKDGQYKFSSVVSLRMPKNQLSFSTWPNPASQILNLQIESETKQEGGLMAVSADGKKVLDRVVYLNKGSNALTLPVERWPSGSYFITCALPNSMLRSTIVITH